MTNHITWIRSFRSFHLSYIWKRLCQKYYQYINYFFSWYIIFCVLVHVYVPNIVHIDGLVQDCSISIANALELLQACTKASNYALCYRLIMVWYRSSIPICLCLNSVLFCIRFLFTYTIPQCACPRSHDSPSRTEMCTCLVWMMHC